MLSAALDRIHQSGAVLETAAVEARGLALHDLWRVAVFHLASMLRQRPLAMGSAETGLVRFEGFTVRLRPSDSNEADIVYYDRKVNIRADGVTLNHRDGPRMLSDMLRLLHYARDHSDTLSYLPGEMRAQRLGAVALDCGTTVPFTRFVCANFPFLQRTNVA